jgi:signal transduction histidine kinase
MPSCACATSTVNCASTSRTTVAASTSRMRSGAGLTHMQDRLDALSGALHVDSHVGGGTRVSGRVPLAVLAAAD